MLKRGLLGLTVGLLVLGAPAAHAQEAYPPVVVASICALTATPSSGAPGSSVNLTVPAGALAPGTYPVVFASTPAVVGSISVGAGGGSTSVAVPSDATPGPHTLTVAGSDGSGAPLTCAGGLAVTSAVEVAGAQLTQAAQAAQATQVLGETVAATGANSLRWAATAAALVALGTGLVLLDRRRAARLAS